MVWTEQEIQKYGAMSQRFDILYTRKRIFRKRISPEKPESRSRYLTRKIMKLSKEDRGILREIAEKNGEAVTLIALENTVIKNFINHSKTLS